MQDLTFRAWYFDFELNTEIYHDFTLRYTLDYKGNVRKRAWHDAIFAAETHLKNSSRRGKAEICKIELLTA